MASNLNFISSPQATREGRTVGLHFNRRGVFGVLACGIRVRSCKGLSSQNLASHRVRAKALREGFRLCRASERKRLRSAARTLFTLKAVAVPPRCGNYGFKTTGFTTAVRILVSTAACAARLLIRGLPEAQNRYGSVVRKGERQQPTVAACSLDSRSCGSTSNKASR